MNNSSTDLDPIGAYGDLLGQQYYDMVGSRRTPNGPRTLMFAVLEDGVRCYLTNKNVVRSCFRSPSASMSNVLQSVSNANGPTALRSSIHVLASSNLWRSLGRRNTG